MDVTLNIGTESDLGVLLPMVAKYHESERITSSHEERAVALTPLLRDPRVGLVWIIRSGEAAVGYMAVCFCYSIEFGGRDCFIDEFFIGEEHRRQGIGARAIHHIVQELRRLGIRAVSLEIATSNAAAQEFYLRSGFEPRNRYSMMTRVI